MNRSTRGVLLAGTVCIVTAVGLGVVMVWSLHHPNCKTGFPTLISCTFTW